MILPKTGIRYSERTGADEMKNIKMTLDKERCL